MVASKRKKRLKVRRIWAINPKTKVKKSKKTYKRSRHRAEAREEIKKQ